MSEETLEHGRVGCITVVALFRVGFFPLPAWSPVWLPGGWGFPVGGLGPPLVLKD